jgi:membrane protein DedA with SNARE-associated domain
MDPLFLQEAAEQAFELLEDDWWVYVVVFLFVFIDGWFPVVPGETTVTAAVAVAVANDDPVWPFWIIAFVAAVAGDTGAYLIGRKGGPRLNNWLIGKIGEKSMGEARSFFDRQASLALCFSRILPGVRFAMMILAGARPLPYFRRYLPFEIIGAGAWATLTVVLAAVVSEALDGRIIVTLSINFGLAVLVGALLTLRERRYRQSAAAKAEDSPQPAT